MAPRAISVEQLAMETAKVVRQARKRPVIVRESGQPALVLRPLADDDTAEELLLGSESFLATIRQARRRRRRGKGVPLAQVRKSFR